MPRRLTRAAIGVFDTLARWRRPQSAATKDPAAAAKAATGRRGEEATYFYLREQGYVIVARNYRSPRRSGEVDLIGWDGDMLCFIEVKTRSTRDVKPAEAAVDRAKKEELIGMAREFLRRQPPRTAYRFDVVSVYYDSGSRVPQITLFKGAFRIG
ncbi:MAG TPA: YraN family protein [Terriglobales bacterium]|nr:YraN family protein [Terriglobales bacterium]